MTHTATIVLATIFFFAPLFYKKWKAKPIILADFVNCSLAAMSIPNLIFCFIGLIFNPLDAIKTQEFSQYLAIGILIMLYIAVDSIISAFIKDRLP
jgi:hypothetical protein